MKERKAEREYAHILIEMMKYIDGRLENGRGY